MIKFSAYKKHYSGNLVLDIPWLELQQSAYWLKGINGSGKSTFLKSLAGLIPFEGKIHISNIDIQKNKRAHRQMVNFGAAEPMYPGFLTGMDLVNFYSEIKKINPAACLHFCGELRLTEEALRKQTGAYSSGMLKKLSLALSFTGKAAWILLDEPLITLDTEAVAVVLHRIETESARGTGMIITSHQDMDFPQHNIQLTTLVTRNQTITKLP